MTKNQIDDAILVATEAGIPIIEGSQHGRAVPFLMLIGNNGLPYIYDKPDRVSPVKWNPYENESQAVFAVERAQKVAESQGLRLRVSLELLNNQNWRCHLVYFKAGTQVIAQHQWAEGPHAVALCDALVNVNKNLLPPTKAGDVRKGKRDMSGEDYV